MIKRLIQFYSASPAVAPDATRSEAETSKQYQRLRWSTFLAATIGYSLYYVCRTSLNIVKKPIMDSGALDATHLGTIGSALLFTYAIGKFVNSFMADRSNIKRFMATGLIISALANVLIAFLGLAHGALTTVSMSFFISFAILWGINGWAQSMGSGPSIVSLSRWFPKKERGTFYGFFSASHNLGEFFSFVFVGSIVGFAGWQWGFMGSCLAGVLGVIVILLFLHDSPESKGLPAVEALTHDGSSAPSKSVKLAQRDVLKNWHVWMLALSSAFMYVSRYAINGWGVLFLQEHHGFSLETATMIISINALFGIIGTVLSGWFSDKFFKGKRNMPALLFGLLNTASLVMFLWGSYSFFWSCVSMMLFGIAIGVLICFLGGLMAVDIVPRNASGAALGIVGIASYIAAAIQDVVSGSLIDSNKVTEIALDGSVNYIYDFNPVAIFWVGSSVLSILFATLVWNAKAE